MPVSFRRRLPLLLLLRALLLLALLQWLWPQPAAAAQAVSAQRVWGQARLEYRDPRLTMPTVEASNVVVALAPVTPPSITFYADDGYREESWMQRSGRALFVQLQASACNRDPAVREEVAITLHAWKHGSVRTYAALETSANSGVFRIPGGVVPMEARGEARMSDRYHATASGDALEASFSGCNGVAVSDALQVDPGGIVFDAATGQPVPGATVSLIDASGAGNGGRPGAAASVRGFDGSTPAPATVVTGSDGVYTFPSVLPGRYRLNVVPPATHTFPSSVAASRLPAAFEVSETGSYGVAFDVTTAGGAVVLDVPVDPVPRGLSVQMTASRSSAEIAETVDYLLTVKNIGDVALDGIRLDSSLPAGFAYLPGSIRLDGASAAEPSGGRGPALGFAIGTLQPGESRVLRYRVRLGAGALTGDGISRAQARALQPLPTTSNLASVRVKVEAGVFSDKAIVLGSVFADCNANGLQDEGERGAPGVRLWLEDGSVVVTDGAGRYSLYGLSPKTHVLKIDSASLPDGAVPTATTQRHAGDGDSRFVDVRHGELHRADFALGGCSPALLRSLEQRRTALGVDELGRALKTELKPTGVATLGDLRALPAQGLVGELNNGTPAAPASSTAARAPLSAVPSGPAFPQVIATAPSGPAGAASAPAEPALDNSLAFVDWRDGQTVGSLPQSLRVKGRLGATLVLQVNGVAVGDEHVGQRSEAPDAQAEVRDYVGVQLRRGENTLLLTEADPFGRVRASRTLHVVVPGELARIVVTPSQPRADADGQGRVAVRVELQDAQGLAIVERLPLTLQSTAGQWDSIDVDSRQPGVQTFVEGGRADFALLAPAAPAQAVLSVQSMAARGESRIDFVPALRPMMAVGIVEGALNLRKLDPKALVPARRDDGFEGELQQFAGSGGQSVGGRAALFLKGKVRGDYLLTLGYDSDKPADSGLFRDIQPDAFYPVYGDSSVRGFDAQSTGKLYVRVEKNRSYLLYGDFTTQAPNSVRQLGAYQRSLNGIKQHYEDERVVANVFASHDSTRQLQDELRADGTSGPYALSGGEMIANSEKVEILVRDRNQPALVLKATPLARFSDYEIDALSGRLLFRAPVASLDADLNPVSIRITYEVAQDGPAFWVAGADAQLKVTESLEIGGSFVEDLNPLEPFQLGSVNGALKLGDETVLSGELARVERELSGAGNAQRIELQHAGTALKARLFAARSDAGFDNRSATITSGRSEGGAKLSYALDERTRLTADALHSGDVVTGNHRDGALLGIERSFDGGTKVEVGTRYVREVSALPGQASGDTATLRVKAMTVVPGLPLASVFVEAEQDVRDSGKRLLALGGEYQIANQGRVYLRHELISSLTGPYALDATQRRNTTVLGVDAEVMTDGRLFSEYRGRESFDGRGTEAAMGLRNRWALAEGLRLNTSFERVQAISGEGSEPATALTGAIEYTADPLWKGTARLELRDGATSRSLLSTLGLARKLDADWTFLGKNVYAVTEDKAEQPTRLQERLQLGVAYRDSRTNRINALGRYEFRQERGQLGDPGTRSVHIVSTHADYQPRRELTFSGHLAAKRVAETLDGQPSRASAQLASVRAVRDLGSDWDIGLAASLLASDHLRSRQSAIGAEAGYQVQKNLWVSAGYNVSGFHDRDLSGDNYTNRGAYLRLRFKFDEKILPGGPG